MLQLLLIKQESSQPPVLQDAGVGLTRYVHILYPVNPLPFIVQGANVLSCQSHELHNAIVLDVLIHSEEDQ